MDDRRRCESTNMHMHKPYIVGLAGGSGSGKTTLAHILEKELPWEVTVVGLDQFYKDLSHLTLEERLDVNFDHPESLDFDQLVAVVEQLRRGEDSSMPIYDFTTCNPTGERTPLSPTPIILVEGMQILHHIPLLQHLDLSIFLNIAEQTRFQRKLERDMRERGRTYENVMDMWKTRTQPMHGQFVQPSRMRADLVFNQSYAPQVIEVTTDEINKRVSVRYSEEDCHSVIANYDL